MEKKITKKESVQLIKKRLKIFLKPLGFQLYPRSTDRFVRVQDKFIDEIYIYHARRIYVKIEYYIRSRSAPFAWLQCDEERLWRAAKKPASDLTWHTDLLWENGLGYFETVWRDVTCAFEQCILPEMENMTIDTFLSRQMRHDENMQVLFLAYETIDLEKPCAICSPQAAAHGILLWHLGRFEEGVPYLNYARQSYHAQLANCEPELREVFHRQFLELALLEELLSLWECKEENGMLAIQQRLNRLADDWVMYI